MDLHAIALLRLIHVVAGAIWFGAVVVGALVFGPAIQAAGDGAKPFMAALQRRGGPGKLMGPVAAVAVLSGLLIYVWSGYAADPFGSLPSTLLTLGAVLALATWLYGLAVGLPLQRRMAALGAAIGAGGPAPEHAAEMRVLQGKMAAMMRITPVLVSLVFVLMVGRAIVS